MRKARAKRLRSKGAASCGRPSAAALKLENDRRNVVFWLSDDTRADKFKLEQVVAGETPVLDEFSKKATRFSVTYAQGNESRVNLVRLYRAVSQR